MPAPVTFTRRLLAVVIPTSPQVLAALVVSLALLVCIHSAGLLKLIGITPAAISASQDQFHARFDSLLRSPIASHLALVTFWALVGLVAYLVCWGAYNVLIEARNEVTLNTAYVNRGHWRGPYETLALKSIAAVGLALIIVSLWNGISFWLALSDSAVIDPSVANVIYAVIAVLGLALQLYSVLVFIQLTFTPWYRAEAAFTES
jgi:hypothetical protein